MFKAFSFFPEKQPHATGIILHVVYLSRMSSHTSRVRITASATYTRIVII